MASSEKIAAEQMGQKVIGHFIHIHLSMSYVDIRLIQDWIKAVRVDGLQVPII